jgi:hypothetical protein
MQCGAGDWILHNKCQIQCPFCNRLTQFGIG